MLPVSQAPSICTGGASSSYHKKFENSLSTEEEDLVPAMGSMMLPVSQAPSICIGEASLSHHKKFENSLSTEEEDIVPAMEDEVDGEEDKSPSFCPCW
ncbi:hypothetical protein F2Q69_00015815 [Brassica cretica]|uniref:Uncharacterized protein n=1 Tax=Brassica cretica TaxID=69181 RepID=A0A8S9RA22_BRACR|nr:hypothetical protein F2Q69_00015815 [Brassica cretica]